MNVSSKYVGRRSRPYEIALDDRRTMGFAASVADANPCYFDDTREGGVVAPPMISVALTWHMASRFSEFWDTEDFPIEILARQVHYSETLEWRRLMRPADRITITGEVAAILPHRAGTHLVLRFQAEDERGQVVFIEHIGGMLRGVACTDSGAGAEQVPAVERPAERGEALWEAPLHIDPLAPWVYDHCADIHFPIHTSRAFATAVGLPGVIYHGTATLSLALRELVNREADGDPGRLRGAACLFTGMVEPGSDIRVAATRGVEDASGRTVHFQVFNEKGHKAIRYGRVTLSY